MDEESKKRLRELDTRITGNPSDEDALIERGRLHWALGHRSAAINDYLAARRLNPEGRAEALLKATYDILDFYNKDLYNP
ncbi:MAG: hypothetical protein J5995_02955 [Muribaculaceae bacterium]|nr:hypothetical protein [Muribaculaceae bacterium]